MVIGFRNTSYSANEGDGTVSLVVEILSGRFADSVSATVGVTLADDTALGKETARSEGTCTVLYCQLGFSCEGQLIANCEIFFQITKCIECKN